MWGTAKHEKNLFYKELQHKELPDSGFFQNKDSDSLSQCMCTCDRYCSYTMKISPHNSKWSSITTELAVVAKPGALLQTMLCNSQHRCSQCCLEAIRRADTRHFHLLQSRSGAELISGAPAPTSQAPGEVTVLYEPHETVIVTQCWLSVYESVSPS